MSELIENRERINEQRKRAKRALYKLDSDKQCVVPTSHFIDILDANQIYLQDRDKN